MLNPNNFQISGRVAPAPNEPRKAEDLRDAPDDGLEPEPEDDIPRDSKS